MWEQVWPVLAIAGFVFVFIYLLPKLKGGG
jgi:hypothetical protein